MTNKRARLFYGWLIVFVSAVGLFLGAPLLVFSFSVFFKPLVGDFHASRAAVSLAFSLFNFAGALWLPGTGLLIDRFGAKRVILVSTLLYGLALCSALWVATGLWQLYLFFILLALTMSSGPAPVPYGVVISHWFNRNHSCLAPERPRTARPATRRRREKSGLPIAAASETGFELARNPA